MKTRLIIPVFSALITAATLSLAAPALLFAAPALLFAAPALAQDVFKVELTAVEDRKSVFATVESVDEATARARIGGTITELMVDEGVEVKAGDLVARVSDPKIALRMKSLDAQISSLQSQYTLAKTERDRSQDLFANGTIPKVRLDQAMTAYEVVDQGLKSVRAERQVLSEQLAEGAVYAPGDGRILKVNVTEGAVVMPGETVASMAASSYILRMQLPERHATALQVGDPVLVAERGLGALSSDSAAKLRTGIVWLIYPEIKGGRVAADIEVAGLGDFFVGERIRVYISTGARATFVVPEHFLFARFGLTYVRLEDGSEVVVQPGLPATGGVEILSGLREGDTLLLPVTK